jgi:hypothetical protein
MSLDLTALVDHWSRSGAEEHAGEDLRFPERCDIFGDHRPEPETSHAAFVTYFFEKDGHIHHLAPTRCPIAVRHF